jgi:hypothetical protein
VGTGADDNERERGGGLQELSLFRAFGSERQLKAYRARYVGFITSSMTKQKSQNSVRWQFSGSSPSGRSPAQIVQEIEENLKVSNYIKRCSELTLQRGAAARVRHTREATAALSTSGVRRRSDLQRSHIFLFYFFYFQQAPE